MAHQKEINLDEITDVNMLQNLLDQTEDIDDRKAIRNRIQEIRSVERGECLFQFRKIISSLMDSSCTELSRFSYDILSNHP